MRMADGGIEDCKCTVVCGCTPIFSWAWGLTSQLIAAAGYCDTIGMTIGIWMGVVHGVPRGAYPCSRNGLSLHRTVAAMADSAKTVRSRPTFCRICEAACGLLVDFDAAGQPLGIRPDRQHLVSRGFACAKGTRFLQVAQHRERLMHPLQRRADGRYAQCSWPQAMALVAHRLRPLLERYGPHAIGIYFGNQRHGLRPGTLCIGRWPPWLIL